MSKGPGFGIDVNDSDVRELYSLPGRLSEYMEDFYKLIGSNVIPKAKSDAPKKTGALAGSLYYTVGKSPEGPFLWLCAGKNIRYGHLQEYGFRGHYAPPDSPIGRAWVEKPLKPEGYFLRPAANEYMDKAEADFDAVIRLLQFNRFARGENA